MVACEVLSYWAIYSPPEKLPPPILRRMRPGTIQRPVSCCLEEFRVVTEAKFLVGYNLPSGA
ncbi:hypothetical protein JZ751_018949 [Albula glossodonta]|uniref:Uncharacterized protein n=1 Tax=Albula glossodonta TaxID=121402 RepID=A0A8T2N0P0_9TELE|nr:hypothetical protein JZ751_018949 [Albula glossodonta]